MNKRRTNLLLAVAIIIVVLVASVLNPPDRVEFHIEEDVMYVDGPEGFRYSTPLGEIEKLLLVEDPVYGEEGEKTKGVVWGSYTNDTWGEHMQCAYAKIPVCIAVYGPDGILLFNFDDEEITRKLYEALLEYPTVNV